MNLINLNLTNLRLECQTSPSFSQYALSCVKKREWKQLWLCLKYSASHTHLLELVKKVNATYVSIEQKGVPSYLTSDAYSYYHQSLQIFYDVVSEIERRKRELGGNCPQLEKACHGLKCREISLRYSVGFIGGGLNPTHEPNKTVLNDLVQRAQTWKNQQILAENKTLNQLEIYQLRELAKYPEWIQAARENPRFMHKVFKWSLRNYCPVEVLVKCPATSRQIEKAHLSSSIGYVRHPQRIQDPHFEVLKFEERVVEGISTRVLTASVYQDKDFSGFRPEYQRRYNILNPNEVIDFGIGNYSTTVQQFFQELGARNQREIKISLTEWGFINLRSTTKEGPNRGVYWNANARRYEPLPQKRNDESVRDWMIQHIPHSRIVTHQELVNKYGERMNGKIFFFKMMATRRQKTLKTIGCHGFSQLYLRMQDGNWKVIDLGAYGHVFQRGPLEAFWLFCHTLWLNVAVMDQNANYTHRQRTGYAVFPEGDDSETALNHFYDFIWMENVFQFTGRNCAYWVQQIQKVMVDLPNLFYTSLTEGRVDWKPLDAAFAWASRQQASIRQLFADLLQLFFLAKRSLKVGDTHYSVYNCLREENIERLADGSKNSMIYNPAFLGHQLDRIRQKARDEGVNALDDRERTLLECGEISWSHTDDKPWQVPNGLI